MKRYNGRSVVDNVSFTVAPGEITVLIGESGCGKTTTLKMINRLIPLDAGTVMLSGRNVMEGDVVELRRSVGFVFQNYALFPHMTVAENIAVTPRLLGWEADRIAKRTAELLELVGLAMSEYGERAPAELSGGQRQRVGVARALAAEPSLILMDEPFGALDPLTRDRLQTEFLDIQKQLGFAVLLVTHDMSEALAIADQIIVLDQGRIVQKGSPSHLLAHPDSDHVKKLMSTPLRQASRIEALMQS